jgi:hypothetical protein
MASEWVKARKEVCRQCPLRILGKYKFLDSCAACGCPINGKIQLRSASCPLGKWGSVPKLKKV